MAQIDNKFKVKKGLDVIGEATFNDNVIVATQPSTDNSTKVANTAFVKNVVSELIASAPDALNTLNELATALGNDAAFSTTVTNNIALKAPLASPALTGAPTAPTAAVDTNTTQLATTAFVLAQAATTAPSANGVAAVGTSKKYARQDHVHATDTSRAPVASPTFTGTATVPYMFVNRFGNPASGIQWYNTTFNAWTDYMAQADTVGQGPKGTLTPAAGTLVTTWARRSFIENLSGYGWIFESGASDAITPSIMAEISSVNGNAKFAGTVYANSFSGSATLSGTPTAPTAAVGANTTQIATTEYVDRAVGNADNSNDAVFNGVMQVEGGIYTSDFKTISNPKGARYNASAASVTGAFKITLPVLYTNAMMMMTVKVFEMASNESFEIVVGGQNSSASPTWLGTFAYMIGGTSSKIPNVRFGNDGTNACIWIGDIGDVWDYPQVFVTEVQIGSTGATSAFARGTWSVAPITVLDTVKVGPTAPMKAAGLASPTFTGVPAAPTAAAGTNTTQIATTAFVTAADALKANLASPALTGTPTAPTATAGTNTTQIATTAFVNTAIANVVSTAPAALDTLNELAAALGNDANFATTVTNSLALKAPLASPALSGVPTAPTAAVDTNTTQLATTAYVVAQSYLKSSTASTTYAPLASPSLTGTPVVPTATKGTNTTQIASTAFVQQAINSVLSKAITGNVTLTATEALNMVIVFTGALTANTTVTIPAGNGIWVIVNNTTGAYTLTVKYASGTGVDVTQNYAELVVGNGTNVMSGNNDFANAYLGGTPTATTAASTDNSTRVATTAYVKSQAYLDSSSTIDGGTF